MNFVKTYIYEQEINEQGVTEVEKDARSSQELQKNEILKDLPEFRNRDGQFLSLAEQIELRKNRAQEPDPEIDMDPLTLQHESEIGKIGDFDSENSQNLTKLARVPGLNEEDIQFFNFIAQNGMYSRKELKQREQQMRNELNEALINVAKKKNERDEYVEEKEMINLKLIKEQANKIRGNLNKRNIKHSNCGVKVVIKKKKCDKENQNIQEETDKTCENEKNIKPKNNDNEKELLKNEDTKEKLSSLLSGYSDDSNE